MASLVVPQALEAQRDELVLQVQRHSAEVRSFVAHQQCTNANASMQAEHVRSEMRERVRELASMEVQVQRLTREREVRHRVSATAAV